MATSTTTVAITRVRANMLFSCFTGPIKNRVLPRLDVRTVTHTNGHRPQRGVYAMFNATFCTR